MLSSNLQSRSCTCRTQRLSRKTLSCRAFGQGTSTGLYKEEQKVKVVAPVTLYSVPKHQEKGLNIQGMEGVVGKDVTQFKGKVLSANLPYLVKFNVSIDGADVKFQAHLGEDEINAA